jgi:hypothetical protein
MQINGTGAAQGRRVAACGDVSTALALLSDHQLGQLVDAAPTVGAGIGGTSAMLHVGDIPVFVKRIPLTELERQPHNVMSTANLFGLPTFCQYGVGSPGFGAWRELAANAITADVSRTTRIGSALTRPTG